METFDADNEREEFQRRSDAYEPQVEGPLVRQRKSISGLLQEYQNAEQVFRTKIAALSMTHPFYRGIKGDGKCGWTSAVFGYFELLLLLRDPKKVEHEMTRLRSFTSDIEALGYDISNIEFAIDATFEFMESLQSSLAAGNAQESLLLENFNDENTANCIIYYFKLMTSSYMQKNAQTYQYYVQHPVDIYCKNFIEPQTQEIDEPGLQALTTGVIGPAGFALDVLYLDRSTGEQVTPHHFVEPYDGLPLITLLYRPGHYDLVYKDSTPLQVHYQTQIPNYVPAFASEEFFSGEGSISLLAPEASIATGFGLSMAPYQPPNLTTQTAYTPTFGNSSANSASPTDLSTVSEEGSFSSTCVPAPEDKIRFNPYMLYPNDSSMPLSTSVFKNSPFNPNHFQNQSFHPQQYVPEDQQNKSRSRRSSSTKSVRSRGGRQNSGKKHK